MANFNIDKKIVLTGLSALFGAGAFVVDVLSKKEVTAETTNEAAKKAAEIVMESLKKSN